MKTIFIDGLFYKASGIGRYYSNILKVLAKEFKIITSVPQKYKKEWETEFREFKNIEANFVEYERFSLKGLLRKSELKKLNADVYFFPQINTPLFFKDSNIVTTIHDLIPFNKVWGRSRLKQFLIKFFYKNAIAKSKKLIAVSKETKKDIISFFKVDKEKVKVIYNFIDDNFCSYNNEKPLIDKEYILFVGNRKKHKNLINLLYAFAKLHQKDIYLVIAGSKDKDNDEIDEVMKRLLIQNRVIEVIRPSDKELLNLYHNAKLFIFPSFYEGFGYPPLEAALCNTPVIASNIPILKEILGEEIALFEPNSVESIVKYLEKALSDKRYRDGLLEKAKKRVESFKKSKIAHNYREFFKGIL